VLRSIRLTPRLAEVAVIVMSSSEFRKDQAEAESLGADCYIQKPIRLEDFIREVGTAVRALLVRRTRSAKQE
jgi:CheY-like chemotaxis protein